MGNDFSPREIVSELDKHIVGQQDAKRAVAIALRNRWRRLQLPEALREEVLPKNILMIGPTGCGKTEIARRLAKLANAPFLKVEATKFTEVGYVGRDVEQIARDLMEAAIDMARERLRKDVRAKAELAAEDRVLDALCGPSASEETRAALPPQAARRRAERPRDRDRGRRHRRADAVRGPGPARRLGRHDQYRRHAGQGVRRAHQEAQDDGGRGLRDADARGERQAARPGEGGARGARLGRAERHRLHRRDRQDHRAQRVPRRRRRQPRGRAARPAAADRGHDGEHQARPGEDRPRAVHLLRRVPSRQAVRHAARAAGPPADPRQPGVAQPGGLPPHPDRARGQPGQAVQGAAGDREGRARVQAPTRSTSWRGCRPRSTRRSRISARAGCTR